MDDGFEAGVGFSYPIEAWYEMEGVEADDARRPDCVVCRQPISGDEYKTRYDDEDGAGDDPQGIHCLGCAKQVLRQLFAEAQGMAADDVELTEPLTAATYDEMGMAGRLLTVEHVANFGRSVGMRSHDPRADWAAVENHMRHNHTNYDSLIEGLSRDMDAWWDRVLYLAYRARADELVLAEIRCVSGLAAEAHPQQQAEFSADRIG